MSFSDPRNLINMKGAKTFFSMDPNLLRFPEVVLERIQIKMEDSPPLAPPPSHTHGEDEKVLEKTDVKDEDWPMKNQQKGEELHCSRVCRGSASRRGGRKAAFRGGVPRLSEAERPGGHRRGGRKRRGGWHHFVSRERKLKRQKTDVEEERQRGQRFSEEENGVLVTSVLSNYRDLCGRSSARGRAVHKRRLWQEVVNRVNGVATTYRTIEVCKKRYGDCRRSVRLKMAALERQGGADPSEPIRFNVWEEQLRQKISALTWGGQRLVDTSQAAEAELAGPAPSDMPASLLGPCWTPTVDTAAGPGVEPVAPEETSEGEEATSPLNVQMVSEWSEEEPAGNLSQRAEPDSLLEVKAPPPTEVPSPPEEPSRCRRLLTQIHKLRENVVEGNRRLVQQVEAVTSEVRELNSHVRQIHLNQSHFSLLFQNYLSDTKQFYGAMIQAVRDLQQPPGLSPLASPNSSPKPPQPASEVPLYKDSH